MVGIFSIAKTNFVADFNVPHLPDEFRNWIRTLIEYSKVRYALVTDIVLNHNMLRDCYCSAIKTSVGDVSSITFRIGQRSIVVTDRDVNNILHFPNDIFVPDPTDQQLFEFFNLVSYYMIEGEFSPAVLGELYKHHLPKEWNVFFHTLNLSFSPKKGGFHGITGFTQKLGYAVAHNLNMNFGRLVLDQILGVMGSPSLRNIQVRNVECFYPRFLQLILDAVLTGEEKSIYANSPTSHSPKLKNHQASSLKSRRVYLNNNPAVLTDFLAYCWANMALPVPFGPTNIEQVPVQPNEEIPTEEAAPEDVPMDEEAQSTEELIITEPEEESLGEQTNQESYHPISLAGTMTGSPKMQLLDQPPVAIGSDNELETPQVQTTVLEPNTTSVHLSPFLPLKRKYQPTENEGESASGAPHKEISESDPTALSQSRWRLGEPGTTVSPSMSSQQDTELTKSQKQLLGTSSQQGEPIEISPSAGASERESQLLEIENLANLSEALRGAHTDEKLTAATTLLTISRSNNVVVDLLTISRLDTVVVDPMDHVPSQAYGDNVDILQINRPTLNSPEITTLDPLRDISSRKDDLQLVLYKAPSPLQTSEGNLDSMPPYIESLSPLPDPTRPSPHRDFPSAGLSGEVGRQLVVSDSSDETIRILLAGTQSRSSERLSDTPTERLSVHQSPIPIQPRVSVMSEIPTENASEAPTEQMIPHTEHPLALSQRVLNLETAVNEIRNTIVEVKQVQLGQLIEFQEFKKTVLEVLSRIVSSSQSNPIIIQEDNTTKGREGQEKAISVIHKEKGPVVEEAKSYVFLYLQKQ